MVAVSLCRRIKPAMSWSAAAAADLAGFRPRLPAWRDALIPGKFAAWAAAAGWDGAAGPSGCVQPTGPTSPYDRFRLPWRWGGVGSPENGRTGLYHPPKSRVMVGSCRRQHHGHGVVACLQGGCDFSLFRCRIYVLRFECKHAVRINSGTRQ